MSGRPEVLFPLFAALTGLEGVGPKTAQNMAALGVEKPRDLLFLLPYSGIDRTIKDTVQGADLPNTLTVEVEIGQHRPPRNKGGAYRIDVIDAQIAFQLVYFHARGDYLGKLLPTGQRRIVSGKVELFDGLAQMVHPDHVVQVEEAQTIPAFEPVYPLTAGVTQKPLSKAMASALTKLPELVEWIDAEQLKQKGWPDWRTAIETAHAPQSLGDLAATAPARERLAYDEFMAHQLTLALARANRRRAPGIESHGNGKLRNKVLRSLPYDPTGAQMRAIDEITTDLASSERMNRLLQGDVGSGKTLVAFMALLAVV
ncbi:MAG: ATP-dependent DNA helicase RecG, partial [Planktotalea sp.]